MSFRNSRCCLNLNALHYRTSSIVELDLKMPLRSRVFKTRFLHNKNRVLETRNIFKICIELESYRLEFHWKKFYNAHQSNKHRSVFTDKKLSALTLSPRALTPHCLSLSLSHNSHTTLSLTPTHHIASLTALPS